MSAIARVEVHEFAFDALNLARDGAAQTVTYSKESSTRLAKLMLAPRLIGKDARQRIAIYEDLKRDIRQFDHMGHGPIDIALWDWAGRHYNASISELLGGYRKRLPFPARPPTAPLFMYSIAREAG